MLLTRHADEGVVHCRTGSLERWDGQRETHADVHCRTGSLEI